MLQLCYGSFPSAYIGAYTSKTEASFPAGRINQNGRGWQRDVRKRYVFKFLGLLSPTGQPFAIVDLSALAFPKGDFPQATSDGAGGIS